MAGTGTLDIQSSALLDSVGELRRDAGVVGDALTRLQAQARAALPALGAATPAATDAYREADAALGRLRDSYGHVADALTQLADGFHAQDRALAANPR